MEFELVKEVVNRKARIYFKLLMNWYHRKEKAKNTDIMEEIRTTKSEVSACVTDLVKQGYVKDIGGKKKQLTEMGFSIAEAYHQRFELAKTFTHTVYSDSKIADDMAEILALTQGEEMFGIDVTKHVTSPLSEIMKEHMEFTGLELSKAVEKGIFKVNIQFLTIPDGKAKMRKIMRMFTVNQNNNSEDMTQHFMHESMQSNMHSQIGAMERFSDSDPLLCNNDIFTFTETYSMANRAFIRTPHIKIIDGKGRLCLHRKVIHEKTADGKLMEGQAKLVEYFDGERFVSCSFDGDDVDIPLDCFHFCKVNGTYHGKLIMRFGCTVGQNHMPISAAMIEMAI